MERNSIRALKRAGVRFPVDTRRSGLLRKLLPRHRLRMMTKGLVVASAISHVSQPFLKSGWSSFHQAFGREMTEAQKHRFRTREGIIVNAMYHYLAYSQGRAVMRLEPGHFLLKRQQSDHWEVLAKALTGPDPWVSRFCLNDAPADEGDGWRGYIDDLLSGLELAERPDRIQPAALLKSVGPGGAVGGESTRPGPVF